MYADPLYISRFDFGRLPPERIIGWQPRRLASHSGITANGLVRWLLCLIATLLLWIAAGGVR